jgi:hypothetical protein
MPKKNGGEEMLVLVVLVAEIVYPKVRRSEYRYGCMAPRSYALALGGTPQVGPFRTGYIKLDTSN